MTSNPLGFVLRTSAKSLKLGGLFSIGMRRRHAIRQSMKAALYDDIWRQVAAKLGASIESMPGGFSKISVGEASTFVLGPLVRLDDCLTLKLAGNKPLVYQTLNAMQIIGLPDHCTYTSSDASKALHFLETNGGPVVVKPAAGTGAGAGVTTGITTRAQLLRATVVAGRFCDDLIVEEQIAGENYRLLFLGGEMIDAVHRCPPTVVGDGASTISELVDKENKLRHESSGRRAISLLAKDDEMRLFLANQDMSLRTVPPADQTVVLKLVINQNNASENHRVVESVHPSFVELGKKAVKGMEIELAGVDIIAPDITRSADSQTFVMPDINTTPGLHHHYLLSDTRSDLDIGEIIIRYILFGKKNA